MPELPEVEAFAAEARKALRRRISETKLKTPKILFGVEPARFAKSLEGSRLTAAERHGKNLFVRIEKGLWLALHFGLSGRLRFSEKTENSGKEAGFRIVFEDGTFLSYSALFGKIGLAESPAEFLEERGIGPDALALDPKRFAAMLSSARSDVKTALMDQKRIAGVGNLYSDEALFRARIHPKTAAAKLTAAQARALHRGLAKVLKDVTRLRVVEHELPPSYFVHHRDTDRKCPRCKARISAYPFQGRTAYFCPHCQKA